MKQKVQPITIVLNKIQNLNCCLLKLTSDLLSYLLSKLMWLYLHTDGHSFLVPSEAQGIAMSGCLFSTKFSKAKALNLHLSLSGLWVSLSSLSLLPSTDVAWNTSSCHNMKLRISARKCPGKFNFNFSSTLLAYFCFYSKQL